MPVFLFGCAVPVPPSPLEQLDASIHEHREALEIQKQQLDTESDMLWTVLLKAAGVESGAGPAHLLLAKRLPEHPLGLRAVKMLQDALPPGDHAGYAELYDDLNASVPGSAVAASSADALLTSCGEDESCFANNALKLAESTSQREQMIAALRTGERLVRARKEKAASFQYLRVLTLRSHSEVMDPLTERILACLDTVGFLFEAQMLRVSQDRAATARDIEQSLVLAAESTKEESWEQSYAAHAPGYDALSGLPLPGDPLRVLAAHARLGHLAAYNRDYANVYRHFNQVRELVAAQTTPDELSRAYVHSIEDIALASFMTASRIFSGDWIAVDSSRLRDGGLSSNEARKLPEALLTAYWAYRSAQLALPPEGRALEMKEELDEMIAFADTQRRPDLIVRACAEFLKRTDVETFSDEVQFLMASSYEKMEGMEVLTRQAYQALLDRYPESPYYSRASIALTLQFIEARRLEDAYENVVQLLAKRPDDSMIPVATYLMALCEAGLDQPDDARMRMRDISQTHYKNAPIAAKAMRWLIQDALDRQDYDAVERLITESLERYPEQDDEHSLVQIKSELRKQADTPK